MAGNAIDELVTTLYEMIQDAGGVPLFGDRCVIEREKALDILDEIRANIPSDLKMAREIVEKRNEMIAAGKREAETIRKQAEALARQRLSDSDITNEARRKGAEMLANAEKQAREVTATAEKQAKELMNAANAYCDDAMKRTEEAVSQALEELKMSRSKFRQAAKSSMD